MAPMLSRSIARSWWSLSTSALSRFSFRQRAASPHTAARPVERSSRPKALQSGMAAGVRAPPYWALKGFDVAKVIADREIVVIGGVGGRCAQAGGGSVVIDTGVGERTVDSVEDHQEAIHAAGPSPVAAAVGLAGQIRSPDIAGRGV